MRRVLVVLDSEWQSRMTHAKPLNQGGAVMAFGTAWYMDEEAFIYWFATRSEIPSLIFAAGCIAYLALNIPDLIVRNPPFDPLACLHAAYLPPEIFSRDWHDTIP